MTAPRQRAERGVTVVEAALTLPILLLFVFGLVDLGMWSLNSNQAANAARDGARTGVLSYRLADIEGSADHRAVLASVRKNLPGDQVSNSGITVACKRPDGSAVTCANARLDTDRIQVDVEWQWKLLTPIATVIGIDEGASRGSAAMSIVGLPLAGTAEEANPEELDPDKEWIDDDEDGGTDEPVDSSPGLPAVCEITDLTVSTTSMAGDTKQLAEDLYVEIETNGSLACVGLVIEVDAPQQGHQEIKTIVHECGCGDGRTKSWAYTGSNNIWKKGDGIVRVRNGSQVLVREFEVT